MIDGEERNSTIEELKTRSHVFSSCRLNKWEGSWKCDCGLSREIFACAEAERMATAAAAAAKLATVEPVDLSIEAKTEINADAKTAAQVDMKIEEKRKTLRRERRKLALLQQTVQLSQQLLEQKKLMAQSKQQLQHLCQSRVKYVKQHKFWRGHVIADCKSAVVETMCAAKARVQERQMKFNQAVVVAAIEKVAPRGIYISKSPHPPATSRPCPGRRSMPRMEESLRTQTIWHLPTLFKDRERAFLRRQASAGNKGDQSIISNAGYALFQEPLYEHFTQPDQLEDELLYADEGYEWDGSHDFSIYPDEEEFDISVEVEDSLSFVWDSDGNVYY